MSGRQAARLLKKKNRQVIDRGLRGKTPKPGQSGTALSGFFYEMK